MSVEIQAQQASGDKEVLKRAPTLYLIIGFKLAKGLLLVLLGIGLYRLSDDNLPHEFASWLEFFHLDPGRKFFADMSTKLGNVTEAHMLWLACATIGYSFFSLIEGVGLIFRVSWAGWLAMGESVFFIPIELYDLTHRLTLSILIVLILNIAIVWYLFQNRHRLFRHHHHQPHGGHPLPPSDSSSSPP